MLLENVKFTWKIPMYKRRWRGLEKSVKIRRNLPWLTSADLKSAKTSRWVAGNWNLYTCRFGSSHRAGSKGCAFSFFCNRPKDLRKFHSFFTIWFEFILIFIRNPLPKIFWDISISNSLKKSTQVYLLEFARLFPPIQPEPRWEFSRKFHDRWRHQYTELLLDQPLPAGVCTYVPTAFV